MPQNIYEWCVSFVTVGYVFFWTYQELLTLTILAVYINALHLRSKFLLFWLTVEIIANIQQNPLPCYDQHLFIVLSFLSKNMHPCKMTINTVTMYITSALVSLINNNSNNNNNSNYTHKSLCSQLYKVLHTLTSTKERCDGHHHHKGGSSASRIRTWCTVLVTIFSIPSMHTPSTEDTA